MRVSIEWFLLDNWLMNCAILGCAAALSGIRMRRAAGPLLCLLGALYALLALASWRFLMFAPLRMLFGCVLALGLRFEGIKSYLRCCISVLLCAFLLGGLLLGITEMIYGGRAYGLAGGVLIGTVGIRALLLGILLASMLPAMLRKLRAAARVDDMRVRLRVQLGKRRIDVLALVDSGNLLQEPWSGLPVVLLNDCPVVTGEEGYPVRYAGVGGEGELLCRRAASAEIWVEGGWHAMDVMVARPPTPIAGADAILGLAALPPAWGGAINVEARKESKEDRLRA